MICAMQNVSLGICRQQRLKTNCAEEQSNQHLHWPLTESFDTIECNNVSMEMKYTNETLHMCMSI